MTPEMDPGTKAYDDYVLREFPDGLDGAAAFYETPIIDHFLAGFEAVQVRAKSTAEPKEENLMIFLLDVENAMRSAGVPEEKIAKFVETGMELKNLMEWRPKCQEPKSPFVTRGKQ